MENVDPKNDWAEPYVNIGKRHLKLLDCLNLKNKNEAMAHLLLMCQDIEKIMNYLDGKNAEAEVKA